MVMEKDKTYTGNGVNFADYASVNSFFQIQSIKDGYVGKVWLVVFVPGKKTSFTLFKKTFKDFHEAENKVREVYKAISTSFWHQFA